MLDLLNWSQTIDGSKHVMDLGSGHGGGSHMLATKFGCKVTVSGCVMCFSGSGNLSILKATIATATTGQSSANAGPMLSPVEHADSELLLMLLDVYEFPQGINIGPEQNKVNMEQCAKLGVADKVRRYSSALPAGCLPLV